MGKFSELIWISSDIYLNRAMDGIGRRCSAVTANPEG